ncbi:Flp family type IVb pilin [Kordiimonas sp. SCSIO 12610]|uniref:Flp family type IVb pilin n=1 Tax=Kordiimonas sp. SCSIO 12610 TaxID=2829597 RepID=UPI00210A2F1F|nr:Flp family type IVb pilin [Kordiimonas sp. SCSIO 12610]UTW55734.1 Flp family type IVb pilin [Kordiimonas sp. SCSIO 12610]
MLNKIATLPHSVMTDETGATAIEYALLAAILALVLVTSISTMADELFAILNLIVASI